jgi:type IV pilus assembly protein PilM
VLRPQLFRDALERLTGPAGQKRGAALVIPDHAVRMAVLDFQEFPAAEANRQALLRFRLRKSVPFHVDEASVSYAIQVADPKHTEVLAVAIARPILEEYERVFTEHGFRVGLVTPSLLAMAPLFAGSAEGLTLVMKAAGATVSLLLIGGGRIRLVRSVDLDEASEHGELPALVQQTAAYAEDQVGERIGRVLISGFEEEVSASIAAELSVPVEPVRSRFGIATPQASGLLGLMEHYPA